MNESKPTVIVSDDYNKAVRLTKHIAAHAHAMQESLYEVCKGLKEMRDGKLYKELGYQNFEDYTENEVGIRRRQAYTYISVAENLTEDFVHSGAQIGIKKLGLLAMLEPTDREEIQQTVNIEETSVKELKAQIAELKNRNAQTAEELEASKSRADRLAEQVESLEEQVESLENRPIEIAVSAEAEKQVEELKSVLKQTDLEWGQKFTQLEEDNIALRRQDYQQHQKELEQVRAEYERKLVAVQASPAPQSVPDEKEVFKAYLSNAVDAMNRLTEYLQQHNAPEFRKRAIALLHRMEEGLR